MTHFCFWKWKWKIKEAIRLNKTAVLLTLPGFFTYRLFQCPLHLVNLWHKHQVKKTIFPICSNTLFEGMVFRTSPPYSISCIWEKSEVGLHITKTPNPTQNCTKQPYQETSPTFHVPGMSQREDLKDHQMTTVKPPCIQCDKIPIKRTIKTQLE